MRSSATSRSSFQLKSADVCSIPRFNIGMHVSWSAVE